MKRRINYPMGTVSHATMNPEHLIPAFLDELGYQAGKSRKHAADRRFIREVNKRMDAKDYYKSEEADYDLEELFDRLDGYSAPYFYFGAHPGDGSDYGFWLTEDIEDVFDGLTVSDLADVPRDYAGEVLLVNDHGNTSLYAKARTQEPREIWAIV
jgi:hypothetical protein